MTFSLCLAACLLGQTAPEVRFDATAGGIEVVAAFPAKLLPGQLTQAQGEAWLRVGLVDAQTGKAGPPMLGSYERRGSDLVFRPRFGLEPGQLYRAHVGPAGQAVTAEYRVPPAAAAPPPRVLKVYPTGEVLPANHLKWYVYFSRPMRGGQDIFKQLAIVDADGKEVLDPWLRDELWDEEACCLILYIHPGRIKWGVLLRELFGPVLLPERRYRLVVRGAMLDADGRPLGKDFVKSFRTVAEDRRRIELADWTLTAPVAGTRQPLRLHFAKGLDHKGLARFLSVTDATGQRVAGAIEIGVDEKAWAFRPAQAWTEQEYRLTVDPRLEDVAGNTLRRPFDLDLKAPALPAPRLHLTFRPTSGEAR